MKICLSIGLLLVFFYFFNPFSDNSLLVLFLPAALLLGALASPTDPATTLAVKTEYKAEGIVMLTTMGVAAFDDVLGIVNYSLATAIAMALINQQPEAFVTVLEPFLSISGLKLNLDSLSSGYWLVLAFNFEYYSGSNCHS